MKVKTNVETGKTIYKLKNLPVGSYFKFTHSKYNTWDAFLKFTEGVFIHAPHKKVSSIQIGLKDYENADVILVP